MIEAADGEVGVAGPHRQGREAGNPPQKLRDAGRAAQADLIGRDQGRGRWGVGSCRFLPRRRNDEGVVDAVLPMGNGRWWDHVLSNESLLIATLQAIRNGLEPRQESV